MRLLMSLSGKGGVGKSLVAANIAYKLAEEGKKVALLDVDYSNPNLAELLGVKEEVTFSERAMEFQPILLDKGMQFFSMQGICKNKPVSMQGSMYAQILRDILSQKWNADIAVIDMPAGIADQFLEIVNVFAENLLGSVIVFQPAHIKSARRVLKLHKNEGVPVIGLIENMAYFNCPSCGEKHYVFGEASLESLAEEFKVEPLGVIPLSMTIRENVEKGNPMLPKYVTCPVCHEVVESKVRYPHFQKNHKELDYNQLKNDWKPGAIETAVKLILEAKPAGLTFAERIKERLKGFTREVILDVFAGVIEIANAEINLAEIKNRYAFPGGRTIELDITDETLRRVKVQLFLRLEEEALKVVRNPSKIHDEVRIWDRSCIWALLGRRTDTEVSYDLFDAWLGGKCKYYSLEAGTQRALRFMRDVWSEVSQAKGFNKLRPLLEKIA